MAMAGSRRLGRGTAGGAEWSSVRPIRAGSATRMARSQRSGASWLSGCRSAPTRRCARTISTHPGQLGGRREVPVDHAGELAVGMADAHLEHRLVDRRAGGGRAVDDPGHLEAQHLAAHDPVLDDDLESASTSSSASAGAGSAGGAAWTGAATAGGAARCRGSPTPTGGSVNSSARRATSPASTSTSRWRSARSRRSAQTRAGPSAASGLGVEQQPPGRPVDQCRAAREVSRFAGDLAPLGAHQPAELGREEWLSITSPERDQDADSVLRRLP